MAPSTSAPLLRDLIHIPERSGQSDFVLKLASGISDVSATIDDYVVTDRLVRNFDEALGLIASAVSSGGSKAAYLHGSFGAGKSHFMAVLHALLRGEPAARGRDEFAGVLSKHDVWMSGRKFLLVPFHLLGAKSLEQRVLGGYVEHVRGLHPEAPIPAVHRTDALLDNARFQRTKMGDDAFIKGLPGGDEEDEWGETDAFWTPALLDEAFASDHMGDLRGRLVRDLLVTWNQGFFRNAQEDAAGFISLDRGLGEIARHAKDLGYDGLVLFLDELILWLANSIGDERFVSQEIQKITNFVEGGDASRAVPVISFIARQRDLRELVGGDVTGASELGFQDTLNLASGRFETITLEDRNLPEIARKRLLKPLNDEAGAAIATAFDSTTKGVRRDVWDTLLGADGVSGSADIESFRKTYPFSPAFIQTLVQVSSALQRSRTALKLMRDLLVERRDELRLGQLIPLGDLYGVISRGGDQPFTEKLKIEFETAQKIYQGKLRPYLLGQYNITEDDVEQARQGDPQLADIAGRIRAFTGDDRLVRTLLLSALAPSVPALNNLTARRLSALNHGSITSPIPGGEVSQVKRKLEAWAGMFGEIKLRGGGDEPVVSMELIGVDVDVVLQQAHGFDNAAGRRAMVKRLLWAEMGIEESGQYVDRADAVWRGSKRQIEIIFANIRDESATREEAFHPVEPDGWRLIVDYPFDEPGFFPADDRNRIDGLKTSIAPRTVCWLPGSFTTDRLNDLGRLVIIDAVLSGQRFDTYAATLNKDDRLRARDVLSGQRDNLVNTITKVLRQAYGLAQKQPNDVVGFDDHLMSLAPGLLPTLPMGAAFKVALQSIVDQMLKQQYPAHPDFDPDRKGDPLKRGDLTTVVDVFRLAVDSPDGRVEVDRRDRAVVRRVANPLLLGEMGEAAFNLGRQWVEHFHRRADQEGVSGDLKVSDLRRWLDEPQARGLDPAVGNLVLICFAEQTNRAWIEHGSVLSPPPDLDRIRPHLTLREQPLPSEEHWETAKERAAELFGVTGAKILRGRLVSMFVRQVSAEALKLRDAAHELVRQLEARAGRLGIDEDAGSGRLHTARAAADLLDGLGSRRNTVEVVEHLATVDLGGPASRCGKSLKSSGDVVRALAAAPWENFELISGIDGGNAVLEPLRQAATADELTIPLRPALTKAAAEASALLRRTVSAPPPPPPNPVVVTPPTAVTPPPPAIVVTTPPAPPSGSQVRRLTFAEADTVIDELRKAIAANPAATFEVTWRTVG